MTSSCSLVSRRLAAPPPAPEQWFPDFALSREALHVLLEGLGGWDIGLLRLGIVGVERGRLRVTRVSLGA